MTWTWQAGETTSLKKADEPCRCTQYQVQSTLVGGSPIRGYKPFALTLSGFERVGAFLFGAIQFDISVKSYFFA